MKDLRFLLRVNWRIYVFLYSLLVLIVSPLIAFFDSNAVFTFVGIFCFSLCLMSYWIYEDGRKIEQLTILLNSEKKTKNSS
jgi:hypothetical protein